MLRPLVLLFDTSTPAMNLALARHHAHDGLDQQGRLELLHGQCSVQAGQETSAHLVEHLQGLVVAAGATMADVGLIGCGVGPGTFTGTRVAVASAKGFALALGCPVLALDSLAVVAGSMNVQGPIVALLDARRGEVYGAGFHALPDARGNSTLLPWLATRCCDVSTLLQSVDPLTPPASIHVVGPGVEPYLATLQADARLIVRPDHVQTPQGLVAAAQAALLQSGPLDAAALHVHYLRASYAELGVNVPKQPLYDNPWLLPDERQRPS